MWSSDIYKILNRNIVQKSSKYLNHILSKYLDGEHVYRISLIWYLSVLDNFLCHPHCLPNLVHNLITRTIKQFINHQLWSGVECDLIQGLAILFRYSQLTRFELLQQPLFLLPCNLCDMSWLWMHQMKKPQETAWCSTHGINLNQGENSLPAKPSLRDELETDWRKMIKPSEGPSGN